MRHRDTNFGSELFALRRLKGATQADIATRAGIGRGYYSQLENSKKGPPSAKLLQRIVTALDLSDAEADQLFAIAAADRCERTCESSEASTHIAMLVKSLVRSASRLTHVKAVRIEAILLED